MPDYLLPKLLEIFGKRRVVDVFEGTGMAHHAERLNVGGYVVRDALPVDDCALWHQTLQDSLIAIAHQKGSRMVQCGGSRKWYSTLQSTAGSCDCKYGYAGTARNLVFKTEEWPLQCVV